ncbi:MAG: hypothetical protein M0026_22290 [Nocardiopsaceae bacterium]|nr:hypothetical protein [Nocardiopsaceae bacterium]
MPPNKPKGGGSFGIVMLFVIVIVVILLIAAVVGVLMFSSTEEGEGGASAPGHEEDSSGEGVAAEGLEDYEGVWDGELIQYDEDDIPSGTWSATITVEDGQIQAMEYGLGNLDDGECTWSLFDVQATDTELSFSYTVEDDIDCVDNGEVTMEYISNDSLDITVTSVMDSSGITNTSEGTLSRK